VPHQFQCNHGGQRPGASAVTYTIGVESRVSQHGRQDKSSSELVSYPTTKVHVENVLYTVVLIINFRIQLVLLCLVSQRVIYFLHLFFYLSLTSLNKRKYN
jgi:hypothetical protein